MDGLTLPVAALFQLNIWSFAVPAAIISGYWFALRRAREGGINTKEFESSLEWIVGGSLVISHMVEILLYQPHRLKEGWWTLLKFWDGLSSYGGFFGAILVCTVFYRILRKRRWWLEADFIMQGLILGWIFGRLGCTVSGDHPGPRTTVPWAYHYEDGSARHNMGLYEMLFTALVLFPANLVLHRFKPPVGSYIGMNCLLYGAGRFALDFLRATDVEHADPRYLGLTLAHYCSLAIFLLGAFAAIQARRGKLAPSVNVSTT